MYVNIQAIKDANAAAGQNWFSPETMRWWRTRVLSTLYTVNDGALFVTSEENPSRVRVYTVRFADRHGHIHTVGDMGAYGSAGTAETAARRYRRAWNAIAAVVSSIDPD